MTIKEIDNYFISLERKPQNNCKYTLLYTRQGDSRNNPNPFIIFLGHEDINKPNLIIKRVKSVYEVMEIITQLLNKYKNIGYFYA